MTEHSIKQVFSAFRSDLQTAIGTDVALVRKPGKVGLVLQLDRTLAKEAYRLNVSDRQMKLEAAGPAGFYYGLQTLRQLIGREVVAGVAYADSCGWQVPGVEIEDTPALNGAVSCWMKAVISSAKSRLRR